MELEISKESYDVSISADEQTAAAGKITNEFDKLEDARAQQLYDMQMIRDEIYSKNAPSKSSWTAQINLPDIYELAQTLKSHLIENLYSHPEAMFDVSGANPTSERYAPQQKAMLVEAFEKMKFELELEKLVDSVIESGESTMFVGWSTKIKEIRRQKTDAELTEEPNTPYTIDTRVIYDGAIVKHIPCEDFVYDMEGKSNWDRCAKIYRTYQELEQIRSNEANNLLTPAKIAKLTEVINPKNKQKPSKSFKNNRIEILEYWGDFTLEDKVLKNWLITVAGRKEIIRFEPNPFVTNPFVHAAIIEDPQTGRGISPLKIAVSLNRLSSTILNKQLDALSLIINPPYLAPKGCFKGEQTVKPGKIIEYDAALMPNQPIALKFDSALRGWDFIQYFKSAIESATGIFKNMSGNLASEARTATELTYSLNGQAVRLSMIIDAINRKLIIPMVEKTADIIANFRFGTEIVRIKTSGEASFIEVGDEIRSSEYIYRYGDRKATLERKYRFKEMFEIISTFSEIPVINEKINWLECFKFALEQYGVENSDNFLKPEQTE